MAQQRGGKNRHTSCNLLAAGLLVGGLEAWQRPTYQTFVSHQSPSLVLRPELSCSETTMFLKQFQIVHQELRVMNWLISFESLNGLMSRPSGRI